MTTGGLTTTIAEIQSFGHPCFTYVIKLRHDHVTAEEEGFYGLCGGTNFNMLMQLPTYDLDSNSPNKEELLETWSPGDGHMWAMAWAGWRACGELMQRRQLREKPAFNAWSQSEIGEKGWHVHLIIGGPGLTKQNASISKSLLCTSFFKHLLITIRQRMNEEEDQMSEAEFRAWAWLQQISEKVMRGENEDVVDILKMRYPNGNLTAQAINGSQFITRYMLPKNRQVLAAISPFQTTPRASFDGTWSKDYGFTVCNGKTICEYTRRDLWKALFNTYVQHPAETMLNPNPDVWRDLPRVSKTVIDNVDAATSSRPIKLSRKQKIMMEVIRKATEQLYLTYNDLVVNLPDLILMLEGMPGGTKTSEQLLTMIHIKLCAQYNAFDFMMLKTPKTHNVNLNADVYDCNENLVFKLLNQQGYNPWQLGHWLVMMLAKKTGKRNSLLFYGPASTGKTNLAKSICHAVGLYGCVNHNNKQFPFNDAPNKMVLWWEECIMTTDYVESAKCILGGTHVRVDVKHKDSRELPQIPVILSSNHDVYTVQGGNATFGVHAAPLKERITQLNFMKQLENTFGEITPEMISTWLSHCNTRFSEQMTLETFQTKYNLTTIGNSFPLQKLCSGHTQNWTFHHNGVCWHCGGFIQPTEETDSEPDRNSEHSNPDSDDSNTSNSGESLLNTTETDSGRGTISSSGPSVPDDNLDIDPSECLQWMEDILNTMNAYDIEIASNNACPALLDILEEEPTEQNGNLDQENTEPETPEDNHQDPKRARVEEEVSDELPFESQPITESDWEEWLQFRQRAKRRRIQIQSEEAPMETEEQGEEPGPSAWGEKLGIISQGPEQEPIVLHCFETIPDSEPEDDTV